MNEISLFRFLSLSLSLYLSFYFFLSPILLSRLQIFHKLSSQRCCLSFEHIISAKNVNYINNLMCIYIYIYIYIYIFDPNYLSSIKHKEEILQTFNSAH